MGVVWLVLIIVGGVGLVQAAVWIPLFRRWRKRSATFMADLRQEMVTTGERFVIEPESAVYRGGTGPYSAVKGNGTIMLTDRRLLFRKMTGGLVEVPVGSITGTRETKGFLGSRVGGATHFVVGTSAPAEIGFFVTDRPAWTSAVASVRTH